MPCKGAADDKVLAFSWTFNPKGPVDHTTRMLFKEWLEARAAQYEVWQEVPQDDPDRMHLHCRVMLNRVGRLDDVKKSLFIKLDRPIYEKIQFYAELKRYYLGSWEDYISKSENNSDTCLWRVITDEAEWVAAAADPDKKTERKKNRWMHHWASFIEADLPPEIADWKLVRGHIMKHMAADRLEMPASIALLKNRCEVFQLWWNARTANGSSLDEDDYIF